MSKTEELIKKYLETHKSEGWDREGAGKEIVVKPIKPSKRTG